MKFRETMSQLKVDMKTMTFGQKVEHIWSNFKEYILVFAGLSIFIISYAVMLLTAKDTAMAGMMLNLTLTEEGEQYITQEFLPVIDADPETEEIMLAQREYVDDPDSDHIESNTATYTQLCALVEAKGLDFLITDKYGMEYCIALGVYMDLSEILSDEELAAWEGKLYYGQWEDTAESIPCVLDISDTAFAKDHLKSKDQVYLGFVTNTTHMEDCRSFLDFLMEYESKSGEQ